jgi:hypothetical protein
MAGAGNISIAAQVLGFQGGKATRRRPPAASGYYGVYAYGASWQASLTNADGGRERLGTFPTRQEAALAYDQAARQCTYKERPLNFMSLDYEKAVEEAECGDCGDGRGEEQQARGARSSAAATDLSSVGHIGGEFVPSRPPAFSPARKNPTEHESQRLERLELAARRSGSGADTRGERWTAEEPQILAQNFGLSPSQLRYMLPGRSYVQIDSKLSVVRKHVRAACKLAKRTTSGS